MNYKTGKIVSAKSITKNGREIDYQEPFKEYLGNGNVIIKYIGK